MIDIDFFKQYNDRYGHVQGDACLQQVAQALRARVRRDRATSSRAMAVKSSRSFVPETDAPAGALHVANRCRERRSARAAIEHAGSADRTDRQRSASASARSSPPRTTAPCASSKRSTGASIAPNKRDETGPSAVRGSRFDGGGAMTLSLDHTEWSRDLRSARAFGRTPLAHPYPRTGAGSNRTAAIARLRRRGPPGRGRLAVAHAELRERALVTPRRFRPLPHRLHGASPSASPPCASTSSTHAHFALVDRTSARPFRPRFSRSSRSVDDVDARRTAAPSSGVLRFAQKGAMPSATGTIFESSVVKRDALVDVGVRLAGQADHQVELEAIHPVLLRQLRRSAADASAARGARASRAGARRAVHRRRQRAVARSGRPRTRRSAGRAAGRRGPTSRLVGQRIHDLHDAAGDR